MADTARHNRRVRRLAAGLTTGALALALGLPDGAWMTGALAPILFPGVAHAEKQEVTMAQFEQCVVIEDGERTSSVTVQEDGSVWCDC